MTLEEFGFNSWFRDQVDPDNTEGLTVARVTAVHKGACEVSDGNDTHEAKTTGRLRHQAKSKLDYPTVGDWVLVKDFDHEDFGTIQSVLKRQSELKRKTAGRTVCYQLIAANIDTVFIMQSLDSGYNLQRLERYLVMVNESGIKPVVLLSKRDLLSEEQVEQIIDEVRERVPNVCVLAFSNADRAGLDEAMALFLPENTYCIVGSSGVGKTTMLNNLLGEEDYLFTLPVREKDGKGVHSTTWRELITLESGAMVIDTPGMRELGNINVIEGINETFADIFALSSECRFNDCSHIKTLGCAVIQAVEDGTIDQLRYNNFIRLTKEVAEQEEAAIEKRNKDKSSTRFHQSIQSKNRKNS